MAVSDILRGTWHGIHFTMDEGEWLSHIPSAWHTGLSVDAELDRMGVIPAGYETSVAGCVAALGIPTVKGTWGELKQLYR